MDERELKKRINYVLLVFCTVIGWLFLPRQALSDQPIMLALANIIPLVLVAPFFLNFVAICLLDLLSERFVAINLLCGGLGYALAEVACAIDRVLELVPHNPYATDSDYHHVTAAECFQQLCCTLGSVAPAEKRYRKLIERFEAKGDHKFVLYRSLQHLAQVLEQLGQMDASEQISKRMMDTLSLMGSRDSAEGMGIPTLKCESLLTQGNICLKRGQLDEAVTHFQKALWVADTDSTTSEIDRKSFVSRALSSLYEACMLCGQIEQARRAAQQIIELCGERRDHTAADSYYRLSCACIAARDFERAEEAALTAKEIQTERGLTQDDTYADVLSNLGIVKLARGDQEEGRRLLDAGREMRRQVSEAVADHEFWYARSYRAKGEPYQAERKFASALSYCEINDQSPVWLVELIASEYADLLRSQRREPEANAMMSRAELLCREKLASVSDDELKRRAERDEKSGELLTRQLAVVMATALTPIIYFLCVPPELRSLAVFLALSAIAACLTAPYFITVLVCILAPVIKIISKRNATIGNIILSFLLMAISLACWIDSVLLKIPALHPLVINYHYHFLLLALNLFGKADKRIRKGSKEALRIKKKLQRIIPILATRSEYEHFLRYVFIVLRTRLIDYAISIGLLCEANEMLVQLEERLADSSDGRFCYCMLLEVSMSYMAQGEIALAIEYAGKAVEARARLAGAVVSQADLNLANPIDHVAEFTHKETLLVQSPNELHALALYNIALCYKQQQKLRECLEFSERAMNVLQSLGETDSKEAELKDLNDKIDVLVREAKSE